MGIRCFLPAAYFGDAAQAGATTLYPSVPGRRRHRFSKVSYAKLRTLNNQQFVVGAGFYTGRGFDPRVYVPQENIQSRPAGAWTVDFRSRASSCGGACPCQPLVVAVSIGGQGHVCLLGNSKEMLNRNQLDRLRFPRYGVLLEAKYSNSKVESRMWERHWVSRGPWSSRERESLPQIEKYG